MQLLSEFSLVLRDFKWMDNAACRGRTDIDFFPEEAFNTEAPKAVAICATCPVKEDCLEFAVENNVHYGIWGGMNYPQRKRYWRSRLQTDNLLR